MEIGCWREVVVMSGGGFGVPFLDQLMIKLKTGRYDGSFLIPSSYSNLRMTVGLYEINEGK